jgi:deazaflavin-dependent oxidoreductase (nitroreductase family)
MALQGVANVVMRGLLSTPGIAGGIGKYLIILYVVGRKSGRHYTIPVAYTQHEGAILVGTPFGWGKNLRTGEPLDVRYKGKRHTANVEVVKDESGVVTLYDAMCRDNHNFAKFNKVRLEKDGTPNAEDLRAAWQAGARAFKLTLQ